MNDLNSVIMIGNLTRDAELKHTTGGIALVAFGIASNHGEKVDGKWEDKAGFFDITVWGKTGEAIIDYLKKGQKVAITGRLRQDRWEKDGQKQSKIVITADTVQLLGGKKKEEAGMFMDEVPF